MLVCPISMCRLDLVPLSEAEALIGVELHPARRIGSVAAPVGRTAQVMVREDLRGAYPVLDDGIAILIAPEILVPKESEIEFDLTSPKYVEAYAEMNHYDSMASDAESRISAGQLPEVLQLILNLSAEQRIESFPHKWSTWLDAPYDCLAQLDCYEAMAKLEGRTVAQLGGSGLHAVKFLLAGARRAVLLAPMVGELRQARALARACGVGDRLTTVAAVAEEIPLSGETLHGIYSGGSLHHMETRLASHEIHRVLKPGGVFAAAEPWRSALYTVGVSALGKREKGAQCTPLTASRVSPLWSVFGEERLTHHGALTRYIVLALFKAKIAIPLWFLYRLFRIDDALSSLLPRLRRQGSSVSIIAHKKRVYSYDLDRYTATDSMPNTPR